MNGLHKYSLFLICTIWASILCAGSLEIRLTTSNPCTFPWISFQVEGTVTNNFSESVEIPQVSVEIPGIGLCTYKVTKLNGQPANSSEYFQNITQVQYATGPQHVITQILRPGEQRHFLLPRGYAMVPIILRFAVNCDFPDGVEEYRKNNYILDHPILSGKYNSNILTVQVNEPKGIDRLAFDELWNTPEKRS